MTTTPPTVAFSQNTAVHLAKIKAFTQQIRVEDGLLNARTILFLTPSGILFAAYGWQNSDGILRLGISALGLVVAIIWLLCSMQLNAALTALHQRRKDLKRATSPDAQFAREDDPDAVVQDALFGWHVFRPTALLAWWLPGLFIATWSLPLLWALLAKLSALFSQR